MPKTGEILPKTQQISDAFSKITSIGAFGKFIYVADEEKGFYVVEAFD